MTITRHAKQRSQQRSIPLYELELIMQIGTIHNCSGDAKAYTVMKKDIINTIEYLKKMIQKVSKLEGKTIITNEESILTTYHRHDK